MPSSPEIYGIGAIAIALIGLIWKIWADSRKTIDKMFEVVEKNTIIQEKLSRNVEENTRTTQKQSDATMSMLVQILRNGKRKENV